MNLGTITIDRDEARERLAEYERAIKEDRNAEDEAIAMGYRAAARGLPIIRLSECMDRAGCFDNGLPKIAVVRADATECWVSAGGSTSTEGRNLLRFSDISHPDDRGALVGRHHVRTTQAVPSYTHNRRWRGQTVVPLVPPRYRPRRPRLAKCHILWEVEEWSNVVPVDPALLRHIRGDLWAVLATWELSELERAVLAGR